MQKLTRYSQYKNDIYNKLDFDFEKNKTILDVGCGDGTDINIFKNHFGLECFGIDIYKHENIEKFNFNFKQGTITKIPFESNFFDYVFLHDVLHHVDEKNQSEEIHLKSLFELKRVIKANGYILIVEANRYNPLFYPHMVKILGHDHWSQLYFINTIRKFFPNAEF